VSKQLCLNLCLPDFFSGRAGEFRLTGEFDADLHLRMPTDCAGIQKAFIGDEQGDAVGNAIGVRLKLKARATDTEIEDAATGLPVVLCEENGRFTDREAGGFSFIEHRQQANPTIVNEFQPELSQMLVWL
jgi:hypothetical protein